MAMYCENEGCTTLEAGGLRFHAHVFGEGPALVLLHGFPEHWASWSPLIEKLARTHRVIVPDLPGFNLSPAPVNRLLLSAPQLSNALLKLLELLGATRFALAAHDLGGMIAWQCASDAGPRLERLALVSSPHPADFIAWRAGRPSDTPPDYADLIFSNRDEQLFTLQRLTLWSQGHPGHEAHKIAMARSDVKAMADLYRLNLGQGSASRWHAIAPPSCPTMMIYGDQDPYLPLECLEGVASSSVPKLKRRRVSGGGHFLHSTCPDVISDELRAWFSDA